MLLKVKAPGSEREVSSLKKKKWRQKESSMLAPTQLLTAVSLHISLNPAEEVVMKAVYGPSWEHQK